MDRDLGPTCLRWTLGLMFLVLGLYKITGLSLVVGMVSGLPFFGSFLPALWAWLLILTELVGGAMLLAGWKVRTAAIPLAIILVIALLIVHLPNADWGNPMIVMPLLLLHLVALGSLGGVYAMGPGLYGVDKE